MTNPKKPVNRAKYSLPKFDIAHWRILIVDDRPDNLMIAETALSFHGAEVKTANNGLSGLEVLKTFTPTLILLDLSMPEMNGWDMFTVLRKNPLTSTIPVIALTAHVMEGDEEKVMDAGFDGYIPKPFSVSNLVLQIQSILTKVENKSKNVTQK